MEDITNAPNPTVQNRDPTTSTVVVAVVTAPVTPWGNKLAATKTSHVSAIEVEKDSGVGIGLSKSVSATGVTHFKSFIAAKVPTIVDWSQKRTEEVSGIVKEVRKKNGVTVEHTEKFVQVVQNDVQSADNAKVEQMGINK